ncbi:ABC transporter ATP-binding protein [Mycetocola spongiae]|uniref:ABC transporter ATP-binding protein n=1 Tax=Mycetocola spongiae TaxID=2859226 RepID=UPI001CF24785|nr:ABC transporter ATP-binding protein [Mycetocola spongiae]UCR89895.1 ABC transporter ATP-binding protein [Mycetocola spongiae]
MESSRLRGENLTLAYDQRVISTDLNVAIPDGGFTVIMGSNACGKSTLLRSLARILLPRSGAVYLDDRPITEYRSKDVARRLGLLPQSSLAPEGITVTDLIARGRFPHQRLLRQWSEEDDRAVSEAMRATNVTDLAGRSLDELSGGQRQRVWLAMVLAQETPLLLLDEPTTFLDIAHQIEVLDLCRTLNEETGRTIVAVLHDLNHACRYASHIIAMREGRVLAHGAPEEIITEERVREIFGLDCRIIPDPVSGTPLVVPLGSHFAREAATR